MRIIGVTGKPNVGKSTFFSASTLIPVKIANYPFTTIEPNVGVGYVRLKEAALDFNIIPQPNNSYSRGGFRFAPIQLVDLPGLVPGAHAGRGLGNQFLTAVSNADALIHVIDASGGTDSEGRTIKPGTHDVISDVKFLEEEYEIWLLDVMKRNWERISRKVDSSNIPLSEGISMTMTNLAGTRGEVETALTQSDVPQEPADWKDDDFNRFSKVLRQKTMPILLVANKADVPEAEENIRILKEAGHKVIPTSAEAELALRRADKSGLIEYIPGSEDFSIKKEDLLKQEQRKGLELLKEKVLRKWGSTGLQRALDEATFSLLQMVAVFPVQDPRKLTDGKGRVLPDVYLLDPDSTAKDLANAIHSEIGEKFLYAIDVRTLRRLSDDYKLKPGEVISIVSAA